MDQDLWGSGIERPFSTDSSDGGILQQSVTELISLQFRCPRHEANLELSGRPEPIYDVARGQQSHEEHCGRGGDRPVPTTRPGSAGVNPASQKHEHRPRQKRKAPDNEKGGAESGAPKITPVGPSMDVCGFWRRPLRTPPFESSGA